MKTASLKKTALAAAIAGTFAVTAIPQAKANVLNLSWTGAFTFLNSTAIAIVNSPTDFASGYYGIAGAAHGTTTAFGWHGNRTPISGTMSFDTATGAGVGTITPFMFLGDATNHVMNVLNMTFQRADTIGTVIGTMLFSWNGAGYPVSIVWDASGLFSAMAGGAFAGGPTSTISGVGVLPSTNGLDFDTSKATKFFPLGPSPIATTSTNTNAACAGVAITSQVNAYTINTLPAYTTCFPTTAESFIYGGSPIPSGSFAGFNPNFDMTSVHLESISSVPLPPAVWLFGSGLLGLIGFVRRKKPYKRQ